LTNIVGKSLGPKSAVRFGEALSYIEGPLRRINETIDGGLYQIEQIIASGLKESGLNDWTAKTLASAIRGILDVLI
ncbi:TPA: hypothetical protein V1Q22_002310, partial [Streptococcus pneumoniae]|nr:hypothetical protein [Streptococcus pneumoniae]